MGTGRVEHLKGLATGDFLGVNHSRKPCAPAAEVERDRNRGQPGFRRRLDCTTGQRQRQQKNSAQQQMIFHGCTPYMRSGVPEKLFRLPKIAPLTLQYPWLNTRLQMSARWISAIAFGRNPCHYINLLPLSKSINCPNDPVKRLVRKGETPILV
jgi:hypothetical protein